MLFPRRGVLFPPLALLVETSAPAGFGVKALSLGVSVPFGFLGVWPHIHNVIMEMISQSAYLKLNPVPITVEPVGRSVRACGVQTELGCLGQGCLPAPSQHWPRPTLALHQSGLLLDHYISTPFS